MVARIKSTTPRFYTTEAERLAWIREMTPEPLSRGERIINALCYIAAGLALALIMFGALSMGGPL